MAHSPPETPRMKSLPTMELIVCDMPNTAIMVFR